jgi:hypothetical protein
VGWAIVVGCTKRQFQTANLFEVHFKPNFSLKINILQVAIFSKCPYGSLKY